MSEIFIPSEAYAALVKTIAVMQTNCKDVLIIKGFIRQLSDDKKVIYDINLSDLLEENTILLNSIDRKFGILDMLKKQRMAIELKISDTEYEFKDKYSRVSFRKPDKSYIDSVPLSYENLLKISGAENYSKICDFELPQIILERFTQSAKHLQSEVVTIYFKDNVLEILLTPPKGGDSTTVSIIKIDNIFTETNYNGKIEFPLIPFSIISESMKVSLFSSLPDPFKFTLNVSAPVSKEPELTINMWSIARFIQEKE